MTIGGIGDDAEKSDLLSEALGSIDGLSVQCRMFTDHP